MAELCRFYGIVIAVFFRGEVGRHNKPHIHAVAAEHSASYAIADGELLDGYLPVSAHRAVKQFIKLRRVELQEAWDTARSGKSPRKVLPLKGR